MGGCFGAGASGAVGARRWLRRGLGSRGAGVLLAVAVLLIGAGVYLYMALNRAPAVPGSGRAVVAPEVVEAPDLAGSSGLGGGPAKLQFFDRNDPTRVRTQLEFDELDPLPRGRYALTRPRAWVFLSGGNAVRVDAAAGDVRGSLVGAQREIESGVFTGGVLVRVYELPADGSAIDAEVSRPTAQLFTDRLEFDAVKGELFTAERFYASTAELEIEANGLRVLFDELEERIALLETRERGFVRYAMGGGGAGDDGGVERGAPAGAGSDRGGNGGDGLGAGNGVVDGGGVVRAGGGSGEVVAGGGAGGGGAVVAFDGDEQVAPSVAVADGSKVDLYHAKFVGDVRVLQGELRRLESDTLDLWARLVDGKFREELLAGGGGGRGGRGVNGFDRVGSGGGAYASRGVGVVGGLRPIDVLVGSLFSSAFLAERPAILCPAASDEDVVLTWEGPMRVVAVEGAEQLLADDLFARFDCVGAGEGGADRVRVIDRTFDGFGVSPSIAYAATRRVLFLEGERDGDVVLVAGRDPTAVVDPALGTDVEGSLLARLDEATDDEAFRVVARSVEAELLSGRIRMPGAGAARARSAGRIEWSESGFVDLLAHDGNITGVLEEAYFVGDVVASDSSATLSGDSMLATFEVLMRMRGDGSASPASAMDNLIVVGRAVGLDAEGNMISADRFDVAFDTTHAGAAASSASTSGDGLGRGGTADPEPTRLVAEGGFEGLYRGQRLRAEMLDAGLIRDERGRLTADDVTAEGSVVFDGRDGVRASAWKLMADAPRQAVSLIARPGDDVLAEIARGPSVVRGRDLQLNGIDRTLYCFGAGRFDHELPADDALGGGDGGLREAGFAFATWTKSMLFDDVAGLIECVGDAEAVIEPSWLSRDRVRAYKVILALTPGGAGGSGSGGWLIAGGGAGDDGDDAGGIGDAFAGREVLRAHAVGESMEYVGGADAWVESVRFVVDADAEDGRRRDRLIYLEGPEILADQQSQTLSVPHAGRALIDDRRPSGSSGSGERGGVGAGAAGILGSEGLSGTTLFRWQDRMLLERAAGRARMGGGVRLVHRPLGETGARELVCTTLTATLAGPRDVDAGTDGEVAGEGPTLETVDASGAVYVRMTDPDRQLLADRLFYDARADFLEATASDDNRVTFIDERGIPVTAAKLRWNLLEDRVDVLRPTPIVSPR